MKAKELAEQFSLSELQTDYFRLPDETALKLRRLANKYGLGKNRKGRSEARQLWYSIQKAQKEYIEELKELATLDDLHHVITSIFGMTVEEFKREYKPFKNE